MRLQNMRFKGFSKTLESWSHVFSWNEARLRQAREQMIRQAKFGPQGLATSCSTLLNLWNSCPFAASWMLAIWCWSIYYLVVEHSFDARPEFSTTGRMFSSRWRDIQPRVLRRDKRLASRKCWLSDLNWPLLIQQSVWQDWVQREDGIEEAQQGSC